MAASPTQRTLKLLRAQPGVGPVAITERWNPFANIRQDLFGFVDVLAVIGTHTVAVQTTSGSNVASRVTKIHAECGSAAQSLLNAGWLIFVIGWRKLKPRGTKVPKWTPRIVQILAVLPEPATVECPEGFPWNQPSCAPF